MNSKEVITVIPNSSLNKHTHTHTHTHTNRALFTEKAWAMCRNNDMCECCVGQRSMVINSDTMAQATSRVLFPPSLPDLLFQDQDVCPCQLHVRVWPSGVSVAPLCALETGCIPRAYGLMQVQKSQKHSPTLNADAGSYTYAVVTVSKITVQQVWGVTLCQS